MGRFSEAAAALRGNGNGQGDLREQLQQAKWQGQFLEESLDRLELAMDEEGWRKMRAYGRMDFTRGGLDTLAETSRLMYLSNPLIQRAVNVTTYYTFGQGVTYKAQEDIVQQEVVEPMTQDSGNKAELYGHQARLLTDVDQLVDGNVFLALPTDHEGNVSIRSIPMDEIRDIHTKEGDKQTILFYRRCWTETIFDQETGQIKQKQQEALYPDWRYHPHTRKSTIGRTPVYWDIPIIHQRTGGLKQMQFGVPETYAAMEWARAYKKFLENWHTLVASLARFAWTVSTKGSKIREGKRRLQSTIRERGFEDNPPPEVGSVFIGSGDDDITPIAKTGAHTSAEDAKPSRLMVASAMDLPDTILSSDPQQGALATAKTLDRPTELRMRNRQIMWADLDKEIFRYGVDAKVRAGTLRGKKLEDEYGDVSTEPSFDPTIEISYPQILEHDMRDVVSSIVSAATLDGKTDAGLIPRERLARMLMESLGVEDVEEALRDLPSEQRNDLENAVEALQEALRVARASA